MTNDLVTRKSFWDLIENPPANVAEVTNLIHWSMNYDLRTGTPYHLYLDLIGYSDEHYGESVYEGNPRKVLGFMEIDYLGGALKEYANNPQEVEAWIELLMETEQAEAEENK
jgi:hypothetical protein